jgi:AmiR/NasT family two-component response regulator
VDASHAPGRPLRPPASPGPEPVPEASGFDAADRETLEERIGHLVLALEHRTVIGQATGIVMERYQLTSDVAFATLLRISSENNRKVHDLAEELVTRGHVEGL